MNKSRNNLYRIRARFFFQKILLAFMEIRKRKEYQHKIRSDMFIEKIKNLKAEGEMYLSGAGSTEKVTEFTREIISFVVSHYGITSMLDAPCGDFKWMPLALKKLPPNFTYIGVDIVPELIEESRKNYPHLTFKVIDFVKDPLPKCDLIFCRDALQHLPIKDSKTALENFSKSGAGYLLTTTQLRRTKWKNKRDCRPGSCRDRNLLIEPFNLDDPIMIFAEQKDHKFLGLWTLPLRYYRPKK
jgi:hypothetical protein